MKQNHTLALIGLLTTLTCATLTGCTKHTGAPAVTSSGRLIDPSWIIATQSCYPDLAKQGYTTADIQHNLANTTDLHNAFPVYAAQPHAALDDILAKPLTTGPAPDITQLAHSPYPVLTRGQAAAGTAPGMAVVQSTNGSAPPDAFCSVQPGIPQGFSK